MFVGGPTLNEHAGNVRSTLLRRVLADRRTKRREDAASRCVVEPGEDVGTGLESLGEGLGPGPGPSQTTPANYRSLRPTDNRAGLGANGMQGPALSLQASDRCPTCGGAPYLSVASAAARVSGLNNQPTLYRVHELLHFTTTTLWPHFRAQDYAGNCYRSWVYRSRRILKSLVLQALQKEAANISETPNPDALVMCILYLAALDFYGSRDYHPLTLEGRARTRAALWWDPEPASVRASLAVLSALLETLYARFDHLCTRNVSQPVILWCVAVAMIMLNESAGAPGPLVSYMARLSEDAGIDTLDKLVALLESFVWVDAAVQDTGMGMWKRVVQ
ncbi:hypothetical protein BDW66DRAFT_166202 [Aspergillus desertorum]